MVATQATASAAFAYAFSQAGKPSEIIRSRDSTLQFDFQLGHNADAKDAASAINSERE